MGSDGPFLNGCCVAPKRILTTWLAAEWHRCSDCRKQSMHVCLSWSCTERQSMLVPCSSGLISFVSVGLIPLRRFCFLFDLDLCLTMLHLLVLFVFTAIYNTGTAGS